MTDKDPKGPDPRAGVMEIAPYIVGGASIEGAEKIIKLSANENYWGASPRAAEAFAKATASLADYPSADSAPLRDAIADVHGLDPARIICGNGSDELLQLLGYAFLEDGDEVVYSRHGFLLYRSYALMNGAKPIAAAETDLTSSVENLLAACTEKTRLVYLANPNNPTGTRLNGQELERLAAGVPDGALLVLDAAYAEFVDGDDYDGGISLVNRRSNVVMTRTFSKLYGLGGLRIGWGYGPLAIIDNLNRVRGPFNLSSVQLQAAEAAIHDRDWAETALIENTANRHWLAQALAEMGVSSDASSANFILARFADTAEAEAAEAAFREDGILVRKVGGYGLPHCLRITVGARADCKRVAASLRRFRETQR